MMSRKQYIYIPLATDISSLHMEEEEDEWGREGTMTPFSLKI